MKIPTRGRADSSNSIDNSQINSNRRLKNNIHTSPAISTTSVSTTYTSPITRPFHQRYRSRSDSVNSYNSNDSRKFLNSKNIMDKKEKGRSSPHLHSSSSNQFNNNNNYKSDNNSDSYNYKPNNFKNISSNNSYNASQIENDVTSQLSNSLNADTNDANDNMKNNEDMEIPKVKLNNNTIKSNRKVSRTFNSKISINSIKDKSSVPGVATSDIGSYYASNNGISNPRPKSSVSYQYDSSARTLTNGLGTNNTTLNNHTPSVHIYNPNNYLSANQYTDIRKKYSSCYSISSNSTILAPPKKYLNHNTSVYSYPKLKQMIYIVFIMIIIFFVSSFASYSTKWIILDTRLKSNSTSTTDSHIVVHYEFGTYKYCSNEAVGESPEKLNCYNIPDICPSFCTKSSCVSFNAVGDGKDFEDSITGVEDSKDPRFSFCNLSSKSRFISKLYILFNIINLIIGFTIIYLLIKYREYKKGSFKETLRKRISILSEHYSFNGADKRKSKLKSSTNNTPTNSVNNSNNILNSKNDPENISFGHPLQFAEPETYEDSINNINITNNGSNGNKSNNTTNKNGNNITSQTTGTGHITYNIPTSPTQINANINESQSIQINQNIAALYMNSGNNDEPEQTEEEKTIQRKRNLKLLFTSLICIYILLGIFGIYLIVKWIQEQSHIGMIYLKEDNKFDEAKIELDKNLGVSLILVTIAAGINIILALYLLILLCIIHCSKSKIYWHNENDLDSYSQSFDSTHPSYSYNPSTYNQNQYNSSNNTYIP